MASNRCKLIGLTIILAVGLPVVARSAAAGQASEELRRLIDEIWEFEMREDPLRATRVGDHRFDDRLPSESLADAARRNKAQGEFLTRLDALHRDQLAADEVLNYDILGRLLRDQLAEYRFQTFLMPITNREGFHVSFAELHRQMPLKTVKDYENYISRLNQFQRYVTGQIELMRKGIELGYTLPAVVLEGYDEPITAHIVEDPEKSLFFLPCVKFPGSISPADQTRLARDARAAISNSVVPGYRSFLQFMRDQYVPRARDTIAAAALPDGAEFYRHRVRQFTTLDLLPEEVHQIGLREVARIREEMEAIISRVKFEGDFAQFLHFLRTDPRFYVETPQALLKEVALVLKKIDGQLPQLFETLPRTPYGIREVPEYIAPRTTTAYYMPPSGDGTDAGYYYVNTFQLKSRPLYEIEALSLHEAVPGHHLQIAFQQELDGLPMFRRFSSFTAFSEGWALYAERLGLEVGFYEDPYRDFGRLTYEMWRACRLVVDTGIHYLGWSRQQAIDYMAENSALALHNIRAEVDRYISWPGQAVAYKIGELKIRELRQLAEDQLGDRFDLRRFHNVVLGAGAVPLSVLERRVMDSITATRDASG
jgi:uncharacterized protein (DUF885 family)